MTDRGVANSPLLIGLHNWVALSLRCKLRFVLKLSNLSSKADVKDSSLFNIKQHNSIFCRNRISLIAKSCDFDCNRRFQIMQSWIESGLRGCDEWSIDTRIQPLWCAEQRYVRTWCVWYLCVPESRSGLAVLVWNGFIFGSPDLGSAKFWFWQWRRLDFNAHRNQVQVGPA